MKNIRLILILLLSFAAAGELMAQRAVIRGRIVDSETGEAVIGANVIEYDSENRIINGSVSNVNGDFVLEMRNADNTVKISVIGYESTTIESVTDQVMNIRLDPSTLAIDEVTITAQQQADYYLTNIEARDVTASTARIDMEDMRDAGVLSASDAMQGRVTGLDILAASGDPGSGSQLVIRGLSSMGNNQPLIVIDGIPQMRISNDFDLTSADAEDLSQLVNIALQDIKSIEILKDAASTAVYGSEGADGVLLIETFKGRMGKVRFDYQYKFSYNIQPPAIPMLDGDEYIMLQLEEWHNRDGVFDLPEEIAYDRDFPDFYNYSANTDWIGAITQDAQTHDHYFNVSGGGEKTRYFTSFSYVNEGGTTINTNSRRFSTRVNLDYFLTRKLKFSIQFNYTNNNTDRMNQIYDRNIREMAYIKAPNMSIWEYDQFGNRTGEYFTPIISYQGSGDFFYNPVAVGTLGQNNRIQNNLQNIFRLRYDISDWITFNQSLALQLNGEKSKVFYPYNALGTDWLSWNVNIAQEGNNSSSSLRSESRLAFQTPDREGMHQLSGSVSWIVNQSQYDWMNIQSNKTPSTEIRDPSIDAQINWIGNGMGEQRSLGAVGNLNYKFRDKYLVTVNVRSDANSAFGSNNRWGTFYGVSGGWRFSSEPWFARIPWLGESMLRASWGSAGRQPGDPYAQYAIYASQQPGSYIEAPAVVPTQVQLNNLQWENQVQSNIGAEFSLFDDRLFLEGDVYYKVTRNLLFEDYDIPTSSGYPELAFFNGGELQNRGWEFLADYTVYRSADWLVSVNFNTSQNRNRFNRLPENFNTESSTSINNGEFPQRIVSGEPIGSFFGFRYLGVYPSDADAVARDASGNVLLDEEGVPIPMTYQGSFVFKGGDPIYQDINFDGVIDLNDVVYIGDSNPDYVGGFGASAKYKGITFSVNFHYRLGFDIINGVAIQTEGMNNRNNQSKAVLRRWRVQGQNEENMLPRAYMNHPANNLGSDRYVEKGDFIRLNVIQLGYRLPASVCQRLRIRNMQITASGRKLLTFTNYSGQDPEVGIDASNPFWIGVDNAKTPPPRVFTLSVSMGF